MRAPAMVWIVVAAVISGLSGCSSKPGTESLHDSFVAQLRANPFVKNFERNGDEMRFTAPGANGEDTAKWRVHIDGAEVQENGDPERPFKGVVRSSWYSNEQRVMPRLRESNLPVGLTSNGLAQECWAMWEKANGRWSWE
jgi:hypothetical protein